MRALAVFALGALCAFAANAEPVAVRTGEHPAFTRIVVDFARRPAWRLGRNGETHELRVDRTDVSFDLTAAFRRISGDRLVGLRDLGGGRLEIATGCVCAITVEPLANQGLVIDVRDGAPAPGDRFELALDGDAAMPATAPHRRPAMSGTPPVLPVILPVPLQGAPEMVRDGFPLPELPDPETLERIAQTRHDLVDQAARAASQGLITLDTGRLDRAHAREPAEAPDAPDPKDPGRDLIRLLTAAPGTNIRIETQIDRDQRARKSGKRQSADRACLANEDLDILGWAGSDTAIADLGRDRAALVDSRDRPDPAAFGALARRYIYMTFGAEAAQLVREGPHGIPDADLLLDLAAVMDGRMPRPGGGLSSQLGCDGPGALWAMLATPGLPRHAEINRDAVVLTLSGFPPHLRRHLGPPLAELFLARGDRESALLIRNAISRGGADLDPGAQMVAAELDRTEGNLHDAETRLADVAAGRSDAAATAVARLIESRIAEGQPVDGGLIDHASALAFEYDGTARSERLNGLIVEAMLHDSRYPEALSRAAEAARRNSMTAEQADDFRTRILGRLTEQADDATFLPLILRELAAAPIADPARVPVATRLAELGMLAQARAALGTSTAIPDIAERKVLATITLGEGKPDIAESYLAGLSDDDANRLRDAARDLASRPAPPLRDPVATEPKVAAVDPPSAAGVLERNRSLLSESRAVRDTLKALLAPAGG